MSHIAKAVALGVQGGCIRDNLAADTVKPLDSYDVKSFTHHVLIQRVLRKLKFLARGVELEGQLTQII